MMFWSLLLLVNRTKMSFNAVLGRVCLVQEIHQLYALVKSILPSLLTLHVHVANMV